MAPISADWPHPVEGITPPAVFTRWMYSALVRKAPPSGPSSAPTTVSRSHDLRGSGHVAAERVALSDRWGRSEAENDRAGRARPCEILDHGVPLRVGGAALPATREDRDRYEKNDTRDAVSPFANRFRYLKCGHSSPFVLCVFHVWRLEQ